MYLLRCAEWVCINQGYELLGAQISNGFVIGGVRLLICRKTVHTSGRFIIREFLHLNYTKTLMESNKVFVSVN